MTEGDPLLRIRHMLDHACEAVALIDGKRAEDVLADRVLLLAVTHLVEIVGEAAAQVPADLRERHGHIPWRDIIGMRNRLIHGYGFVDNARVLETVSDDLPLLVFQLERLIEQEDDPCKPKP